MRVRSIFGRVCERRPAHLRVPADATAIDSAMLPAMKEKKYPHDFSCAAIASAAVLGGISVERISVAVLPFLAVQVFVLLLLTYLPELTLWLPRALGYF